MILYFDNYMTSEGIIPGVAPWANGVRNGKAEIYRMPSKLDISLYTLASYAVLDWSAVVIKYDLEDKSKTGYFESEVRKLFPKARIIHGRSDSQAKFQESVKLLKSLGDEWIFYVGNNDHPFISGEKKTLAHCLKKAVELRKTHRFVSIHLTQRFESLGAADRGSLRHNPRWKKISEDEHCVSMLVEGGYFEAIQIVHIDLFEHWFCSKDLSEKKVRLFRSDPLESLVKVEQQAVVVPKKAICEHFDGYSHLAIHGFPSPDKILPPLFIPPGFFDGKIRIAYGYDDYREGWVNINPAKESYSFASKDGTDLKVSLDDLPLFWKPRIDKIDVNPNANLKALRIAYENDLKKKESLWRATIPTALKKAGRQVAWVALKTPLGWVKRIEIWAAKPESLEKMLDEQEPTYSGKIKNIGKKAVYSGIVSYRKLSGALRKKV